MNGLGNGRCGYQSLRDGLWREDQGIPRRLCSARRAADSSVTSRRRFARYSSVSVVLACLSWVCGAYSDNGSRFSWPSKGDGYENAYWSVMLGKKYVFLEEMNCWRGVEPRVDIYGKLSPNAILSINQHRLKMINSDQLK